MICKLMFYAIIQFINQCSFHIQLYSNIKYDKYAIDFAPDIKIVYDANISL